MKVLVLLMFPIGTAMSAAADEGAWLARATFAGGCFWCMEPPFDELEGVRESVSGYSGGKEETPPTRKSLRVSRDTPRPWKYSTTPAG